MTPYPGSHEVFEFRRGLLRCPSELAGTAFHNGRFVSSCVETRFQFLSHTCDAPPFLVVLNSFCFPGRIPESLDSGLAAFFGQLRTSDDVVAATIRLSIHEEAAKSATHLALHVPVRFLPIAKGARESSSARASGGTLASASLSL